MEEITPTEKQEPMALLSWKIYLRNTAYILAALLVFLFSLDLMIASLQQLGKVATETILLATSNPFTGLFIGLLVTAIIQSSSATTSMVVALVASGSISLQAAIPIIMGANIGTTITSTIVSLGFITKKKEFGRAVAAGTYHDFFNILTTVILFPLEYYFGFLSGMSKSIATNFFHEPFSTIDVNFSFLGGRFEWIISLLMEVIDNGFLLGIFSIVLLFGSILFFRKVITNFLGFGSPEKFQRFFFKNTLKSFTWGLLTTAAIRSSTVTTSLVVPLVAKKVVKLKSAVPFILGANMGTTITAFIAATFNSNAAISIAIAHFLFNFIGALIFLPIPYLKEFPVRLANGLGRLTLRYRLIGFSYLLFSFFFIPFSLIYLSKGVIDLQEATYSRESAGAAPTQFSLIVKKFTGNQLKGWVSIENELEGAIRVVTVYRKSNLLIINNDLFELNKPRFCRDDEDEKGKYRMCIREVLPRLQLTDSLSVDSVFVFERQFYDAVKFDSVTTRLFVSATENILVKRELEDKRGQLIWKEQLIRLQRK
ncbi:MAG: Na/Pi symporter [Cyclobacteriaceae bacterium]|nr:Na/Pi symporter [Cyclobacteriaceae bacterium]